MTMRPISARPIGDAHAYTRSDVPWSITVGEDAHDKMINYISGGGMRTFGRTIRQEEARRRQRTFLMVAAGLIGLWVLFLFM